MIDTTETLATFLHNCQRGSGPPICAIDTEADSLHRHRESLCLVQFATRDDCLLIDPIAIKDLTPLADFLAPATVWMHGADYDMTMLKRELGIIPAVVPDTQIGARLLGLRRFGLADLVSHYFRVELSKSSQKADWGKRPLSEKMVEYALNDVRYLLEMGDMIVAGLREKGRLGWFEECCAAARAKVMERDESRDESWRVKGSGRLDPRGLAWLRALWYWRDSEAEAWDRPSFMVVSNREMLEWAVKLADGNHVQLPRHYRSDRLKRFSRMVENVRAMPESEWPARPQKIRRKRDKSLDEKVNDFLKLRDAKAAEFDIDASLIATRATFEAIAWGETTPDKSLLGWQRECLGL